MTRSSIMPCRPTTREHQQSPCLPEPLAFALLISLLAPPPPPHPRGDSQAPYHDSSSPKRSLNVEGVSIRLRVKLTHPPPPITPKLKTQYSSASSIAVTNAAGRSCSIIATAGKYAASAGVTQPCRASFNPYCCFPLSHKAALHLPSSHVMIEPLAVLLSLRLPELMMPSTFAHGRHGLEIPSLMSSALLK